jgi:hypothetical protein
MSLAICGMFKAQGAPNYALSFDGVNEYLSMPSASYFGGNFTIEAWVNARSYEANSAVLDFANGATADRVALMFSSDSVGHPALLIQGTGVVSSTNVPLNQWIHLAGTLDGTMGSLYLNGQLIATNTV